MWESDVVLEEQITSGVIGPHGLWTWVDHRFRIDIVGLQNLTFRLVLRITAERALEGDCRPEDANFAAWAWVDLSTIGNMIDLLATHGPEDDEVSWPQGVKPAAA